MGKFVLKIKYKEGHNLLLRNPLSCNLLEEYMGDASLYANPLLTAEKGSWTVDVPFV